MNLCQRQMTNLVLLTSSLVFVVSVPARGDEPIEPVSFIYRVVEDRFIKVHGVLDEDANAPNMIVWDRMKGEAKGTDAK